MAKANGNAAMLANNGLGAEKPSQGLARSSKPARAPSPRKARKPTSKPAKAYETALGDNIVAIVDGDAIVFRVRASQSAMANAPLSQSGKVRLLARSNGWQSIELPTGEKVSLQMVITYRP